MKNVSVQDIRDYFLSNLREQELFIQPKRKLQQKNK